MEGYCVLFISRRSSARSPKAEALVNRHRKGRFRAFGVEPVADIDSTTVELLEQGGYPLLGCARSTGANSHGLRPLRSISFSRSAIRP